MSLINAKAAAALALGGVLALTAGLSAPAGPARADEAVTSHAVFVMYHRFGDSRYPSTNTTIEQLEGHIEYLQEEDFTVLPVPEIVAALRAGEELPPKTIGITIDDAYASFYNNGWPRFRDADLPVTLFVATDPVDRGGEDFMSWDQLREVSGEGVTIGSQTATHPRMGTQSREANREELETSQARFSQELGQAPELIAYPYGHYSRDVMALAEEMGFTAGFTQRSGAAHGGSNPYQMPRFALNEQFGTMEQFRFKANVLPLPATGITPRSILLTDPRPSFGFSVTADIGSLQNLACYHSGVGRANVEILGDSRVEVRLEEAFSEGSNRINCTKLDDETGRWRWLGMEFFYSPE